MRRACAAGEIKITGMVTVSQCSFKFQVQSCFRVVGLKLFRRRRVRAESESLQGSDLMDHGMAAPRLRITVVIATVRDGTHHQTQTQNFKLELKKMKFRSHSDFCKICLSVMTAQPAVK